MKELHSKLLGALLLSFTSLSALATDEMIYGAFDVGQGSAKDVCTGLLANSSCHSTTTAYRVGLGYQANKHMSLEASYLFPAKLTASGTYLGIPATGEVSMSGYQLAIVGSFPVAGGFSLLGKGGIAFIDAKSAVSTLGLNVSTSQSNTNFAYGFGARFAFSNRVAARIMYEDLGLIKTSGIAAGGKVSFLSAGLQVGF